MSSPFKLIRRATLPLANADTLLEAVQVNPAAGVASHVPMVFPQVNMGDGKNMEVIEIAVYGFDANGVPKSGTFTHQFIEAAPWPEVDYPGRMLYTGRDPVASSVTGRGYFYPARSLHSFGLILHTISIADATEIVALWRGYL